ncbi:MAG: type II toxin-antitoxin system VapC family toxin [Coleofasciculaceae cyanobacterium RL_1_1]|nr:type II toxin-antitoxin system VapC family toxin [Coleofasciculaceae cyanobacterium RL_1_1]
MTSHYLLDTNIAIALMNGDIGIAQRLKTLQDAYLSVTIVGELFYGAEKSQQTELNRQRIKPLLERFQTISPDLETANYYATIKNQLRLMGRPIPENDIWIAAIALQHDLTLITRDSDFAAVDGLKLEKW